MEYNRNRIGGCNLNYRSVDEVPRRLSFARQQITELGYLQEWGRPRWWAMVDRLAHPILRFMYLQTGRPWAEVQAEIDARVRMLPAPVKLRDAVRDQVRRCVWSAAEVEAGTGRIRYAAGLRGRGQLYVDPRSDLLCRREPVARTRLNRGVKPAYLPCRGNNLRQFHRVKGEWHEVTLRRYHTWADLYEEQRRYRGGPLDDPASYSRDWMIRDRGLMPNAYWHRSAFGARKIRPAVMHELARLYGRKGVYAESMRRLTRQECRERGLQD